MSDPGIYVQYLRNHSDYIPIAIAIAYKFILLEEINCTAANAPEILRIVIVTKDYGLSRPPSFPSLNRI